MVDFASEPPTVAEGAYGATAELFNGFWMIQVASKEEAREWALRCSLVPGSKLEARRVTDESDCAEFSGNEYLQKEAGWREDAAARASLD